MFIILKQVRLNDFLQQLRYVGFSTVHLLGTFLTFIWDGLNLKVSGSSPLKQIYFHWTIQIIIRLQPSYDICPFEQFNKLLDWAKMSWLKPTWGSLSDITFFPACSRAGGPPLRVGSRRGRSSDSPRASTARWPSGRICHQCSADTHHMSAGTVASGGPRPPAPWTRQKTG